MNGGSVHGVLNPRLIYQQNVAPVELERHRQATVLEILGSWPSLFIDGNCKKN